MKRRVLAAFILVTITGAGFWLMHHLNRPAPAAWILVVVEPMEGGSGFSRGYDTETDCKKDLQRWLAEAAWFRSAGREKDAPHAQCHKRQNAGWRSIL